MSTFEWNQTFVTGLENVDKQHHHLVDLINQFGERLENNALDQQALKSLVTELVDYTNYHFTEEEALMESRGVDKRHFDHHCESHRQFLREVTDLYASIEAGRITNNKYLLNFLCHWLAFHILGEDQNMAKQLERIERGIAPADAFEAQQTEKDSATRILLASLSNLFAQVSDRNRELAAMNLTLEEKVASRTRALLESNEKLETISLTDVLTGLPNRRHALAVLEAIWGESNDSEKPVACMMIDADHFKEVNDSYGHDAGDTVLVELARTLKHVLRNDDIVCRLGGDEFFVICPETNLEGCLHIAEIARQKVSELRVPTGGEPWHGSISIGVAVRGSHMDTHEELLKRADLGLYAAKEAGKNCVRVAPIENA